MDKIIRLKGILTKKECLFIEQNFKKIEKVLTFKNGKISDFKITIEPMNDKILFKLLYHNTVILEETGKNNETLYDLLGLVNFKGTFNNKDVSFIVNITQNLVGYEEFYNNIVDLCECKLFLIEMKNRKKYIYNQILYSDFNNIEEFMISTLYLFFVTLEKINNNSLLDLYEQKLNYYMGFNLEDFFYEHKNYELHSYKEESEKFSSSKDTIKYLIELVANTKYGRKKPATNFLNDIFKDGLIFLKKEGYILKEC